MSKKDYPTPCLREAATGFVLEFPSGTTIPFESMEDGETYVDEHGIHRKFGKVYQEVSPKRFALFAEDDGLDLE
jgi:hypothetical protein